MRRCFSLRQWTGIRAFDMNVSCAPYIVPVPRVEVRPPLHPTRAWRGVKTQATEVRPGHVLEVSGRLLQVLKATHTQGAGRQLGNVQLELRDLRTQSKQHERRRSYDMVELVRLEERSFDFLYAEGEELCLMDPVNFEQLSVNPALLGNQLPFLVEGMSIKLQFYEGDPLSGELPQLVTLTVAEAAPHMRGESASSQQKRAIMTNGAQVMVPSFVIVGSDIVVDTRDGSFVRRA